MTDVRTYRFYGNKNRFVAKTCIIHHLPSEKYIECVLNQLNHLQTH